MPSDGQNGGGVPKPKPYSPIEGDATCVRCGLDATKGYEGRVDFLDFCDPCFRLFEQWLNAEEEEVPTHV